MSSTHLDKKRRSCKAGEDSGMATIPAPWKQLDNPVCLAKLDLQTNSVSLLVFSFDWMERRRKDFCILSSDYHTHLVFITCSYWWWCLSRRCRNVHPPVQRTTVTWDTGTLAYWATCPVRQKRHFRPIQELFWFVSPFPATCHQMPKAVFWQNQEGGKVWGSPQQVVCWAALLR